ncbi:MAG: thermonuclease family protein [Proteobacteria bacterium]|nr:thermonuclease family protein [Pseudomonadota bacterium]
MCLKNGIYIVALFTLLTLTQTSFAESHHWTDEEGVLHFSDRRPVERIEKTAPPSLHLNKKAEEKVDRKKGLYDFREKVVNVIGVDKILLESGKIVKYIGVRDPAKYLRKNGLDKKLDEAEKFHSKLVVGKNVTVLLGKKSKNKKRHYLGHVFLGREAFINAELIRNGYAITEEYPSDFEYQSLFIRLQREAQDKGLGLWSF